MGIAFTIQTRAHTVIARYLLRDCQLRVNFAHVPAERLALKTPFQNESLRELKTVERSELTRGGELVEVFFKLIKPHLSDPLLVSIRNTETEISYATLHKVRSHSSH